MKKFVNPFLLPIIAVSILSFSPSTKSLADGPLDILIIANSNVPLDSLEVEDLRQLFLKLRSSWKIGKRVVPINAKAGSLLRHTFRNMVLGWTADEEQAHWRDQKIRKGIGPPAELSNGLKAVFRVKGSIGYVYRKDYRENTCKILLVMR